MTKEEVDLLETAITKIMTQPEELAEPFEGVEEFAEDFEDGDLSELYGFIAAPFTGVRLSRDEYKIIEPFLCAIVHVECKIGEIDSSAWYVCHTTIADNQADYWVSIGNANRACLYVIVTGIIERERAGYHTAFSKYTGGNSYAAFDS